MQEWWYVNSKDKPPGADAPVSARRILVARAAGTWRRCFRGGALLCMAVLSCGSAAKGLDREKSIDQYSHETWTSQNGLPGEAVYQILQSPDGYLWLRTSAGLVRFDGVRFVLVDPVVEGQSVGEQTKAMCKSADGDLLIRTTTRTIRYRNGVYTDYRSPGPLPDGNIRTLFESKDHQVFVGSDDFIYLIENDGVRMIRSGTAFVDAFLDGDKGMVWIGGAGDLFRYQNGTVQSAFNLIHQYGASEALGEDREHNLWFGTLGGLYRMNRERTALQPVADKAIRGGVKAIHADHDGNLWIATGTAGLVRISGDKVSFFGAPDGLSDSAALSLYEDREGSLWVGTASGLDRFRDTKFTTFTTKEGVASNNTASVIESQDGSLYVYCTDGGLTRIKNGVVSTVATIVEDAHFYGEALFESKDGSVWSGTSGGLAQYKEGEFTLYRAGGRLSHRFISAISEDDESLIVTTSETIALRFKDGEVQPLTMGGETTPLSSPGNYTFTIYKDPSGTMWFGTVKGLLKFAKGARPDQARQDQIDFPVTSISDDHRGSLWLGGRTPGLIRFRMADGRVTRYTKDDGLYDDYTSRVLTDDKGNLWISTSSGIYMAPREDLDRVADGLATTVHSTVYGTADGMKTTQASDPETQPGGWRTRDGKLWFTTRKGIVSIDPAHMLHNDLIPPVVIEEVVVDGKTLASGQDFVLAPGKGQIEIHYTGLSLRIPGRVRFRYLLEGYDQDWVDAGPRRVAYYTNLRPGSYHFRVIACNDDGVWNLAGDSVGFELKPKFYQTIWFYSALILGVMMLAVLVQRFYTRQLRRRAEDLEVRVQARTTDLAEANQALAAASRAKSEFLANMSHEIRTPLNGIVGMTDLALETSLNTEQREYMDTVKLSADILLTVINDILDFSKIEAGKIDFEMTDFDLRECVEATLKTLSVRSDEKGLELMCEVAPEVPDVVRGDSTRVRQILLNLAGNAIKFTEEGEIAVKIEMQAAEDGGRVFHFTVSDTGVGIPLEKQKAIFDPFSQADTSTTRKYGGTGLGLTISTRLVAMMGGRIWVESDAGSGAKFHFTLPLGVSDRRPSEVGRIAPAELLRGVRVLIVDDNRTNRRILEGMLKRWEMITSSVEGGSQALLELSAAHASGAPYALILTDMHMPGMDGFTLIERIREHKELSAATIMMLTSAGHRGDAERCRALGVSAYLLKPIRQSELREAIARVLGAKERTGTIPLITRYSLADAREPTDVLRVLVAEDNPVNQRLIVRLLEKRGHRVTLSGNGHEALEAMQKYNFDLVLMDVQMPHMDGLEATIALRAKEKATGAHVPVVALTAHAMKGDRERCIAAGMDDYLSKPIRPPELDSLLTKYLGHRNDATVTPEPVARS